MHLRNLFGVMLVLGLGPAALPGQGTPPPWAPSGGAGPAATAPAVIATTKAPRRELPADARMPAPDDGLKTPPAKPAETARPPAPGPIQQAVYTADPSEVPPVPGVPTTTPPRLPGSVLGVEVVGPTIATAGQPLTCTVVVRNHGSAVLAGVRVELPLPEGSRVLSTDPPAERPGDRLSWLVGNLDAGAERRLRVEVFPGQPGEFRLRPQASFGTAVGLCSDVVRPPFAVTVTAQEAATLGEPVSFSIQVSNNTPNPLRLIHLRCQLSPGLRHPQGELIETDLEGLATGAQKTIPLTVQTRSGGRQGMQVTATADGQLTARATASVAVNEAVLLVKAEGPRQGILGHDLAYRLEINNPGREPAVGVRLRQALPQGLEFVTADRAASFEPQTQTIHWNLGDLPPGQHQAVTFQVRARQTGDWAFPSTVQAEGLSEVRSTYAVRVDAAPALTLEASSDDDPIDLGRETTCEVRISNQATVAAHGVQLTVVLPDNLAAVDLTGPSSAQRQGQLVLFGPLSQLPSRAVAVYRLRLRGMKPGAGRVRIEVQAAGLPRPVQRDLTSRVRAAPAGRAGD